MVSSRKGLMSVARFPQLFAPRESNWLGSFDRATRARAQLRCSRSRRSTLDAARPEDGD